MPHNESIIRRVADLTDTLNALKSLHGEVWVLFWEVTNLRARIFDTEDLSIIRGGSTMADVFTRSAASTLCPDGVVVVYAAASQVLAVSRSRKAVDTFGQQLQARFVQDPWRGSSGWAVGRLESVSSREAATLQKRLAAKVHLDSRRRLEIDHGGACSPRGPEDTTGVDPLDRIHGVATTGVEPVLSARVAGAKAGSRKLPLSITNTFRFRFGQRHRYGLVARLDMRLDEDAIHEVPLPRSINAWEQVAQRYPERSPHWRRRQDRDQTFAGLVHGGRMRGYMAVIEADGVGFGGWRKQHDTLEAIARGSRAMDLAIERALTVALQPELSAMLSDLDADRVEGKAALRAQLLLWAGDEWVLVVRGERAFEIMEKYESAWQQSAEDAESVCFEQPPEIRLATRPWRMAAVIVNHKTPIRHARRASGELLSNLKKAERSKDPKKPERSLGTEGFRMDWVVLKSHDVPPEGVLAHRKATYNGQTRRLGKKGDCPTESIALAGGFRHLLRVARVLHAKGFPSRQLKRRALAEVRGQKPADWSQDAIRAMETVDESLSMLEPDPERERPSAWPDLAEMMEIVSCEQGRDR